MCQGILKGRESVCVCFKAQRSDSPDDSTAGGTLEELSKRTELLPRVI